MTQLKLLRTAILLVPLFLLATNAAAQQNTKAVIPDWVKMMNDSTVNYFNAVKAFNDFWKNKEKPVEEDEVFESHVKKEKRREILTADAQKYVFEYKKFLNWQRSVLPYVQPDGHILNNDERLRIFEEEQQRRKQSGL